MGDFFFSNLKVLHKDMKRVNETRATFPFSYNERTFSCIFLADVTPYRLYLTTLGMYPIVFELEIRKGYLVNTHFERDDYSALVEYLGIRYDPEHKFVPIDFLTALNAGIPLEFKKKPRYSEVVLIASNTRNIEDPDKPYFCGWRRNPAKDSVSDENFQKTLVAFGDEMARSSRAKNISSCWTATSEKELLEKLNYIVTM